MNARQYQPINNEQPTDVWDQEVASIQAKQVVEGQSSIGTVVKAEDVQTHYGGPTGHYARLTFDIGGPRVDYTATLPSTYITYEKCTKMLAAFEALRCGGCVELEHLIGRRCRVQIGRNKAGRLVAKTLSRSGAVM